MSDITVNADEIAAALRKRLEGFSPSLEANQIGTIIEVGDGIARVDGLPNTSVNELLEFSGGTLGLALNLDEESIGVVVLATMSHIEEGKAVTSTGSTLSVPVGDDLLGRVLDPLDE